MLSFTPSPEQQMLIDTLRRFAQEELRERAREADEHQQAPPEVVQRGWELGLIPATIPEAYGGFGERYSILTGVLALEELAWGDLALALHILAPALAATPIVLAGTEEQKRTYLPPFCSETFYPATAAFVEPVFQFDPHAMQTTAVRNGDVYILNGVKAYVPLADRAEVMLVYAREGEGVQAFIVPRQTKGLKVERRERLMGLRALPMFRVTLEDVTVPVTQRLGGEKGIDFDRLLNYMRVATAAAAVGVARAAYEYAREYAKQRVQFGEPIAHRQAIAFMLAEMAIDIDGLRLMTWEAAWKLDRGEDATREAYLARLTADDVAMEVTDRGVQILGGYGYIREYPVELWMRNGRGIATLEGVILV